MACKCLDKVRAKVREITGDTEADLTNTLMLVSENKPTREVCEPVRYAYREKKADGTFGKVKESFIHFTYCPFCGERYE